MSRRVSKENRVLLDLVKVAVQDVIAEAIFELDSRSETYLEHVTDMSRADEEAQARIGELEKELDQVAADRRDIRGQYDQAKLALTAADAERDNYKSLAERYKFEVEGLQAGRADLLAQINAVQATAADERQLQMSHEEELERRDSRCEQLRLDLKTANKCVEDLQSQLRASNRSLEEATAKIKTLSSMPVPVAPVRVVSELELTEEAEELLALHRKGYNVQQIAARFNANKPQNEWLNGPGVRILLNVLGCAA